MEVSWFKQSQIAEGYASAALRNGANTCSHTSDGMERNEGILAHASQTDCTAGDTIAAVYWNCLNADCMVLMVAAKLA